MIYGLRRTNWWVATPGSLVFIDPCFDFGTNVPDLACRLRLESPFRSRFALMYTIVWFMNIPPVLRQFFIFCSLSPR